MGRRLQAAAPSHRYARPLQPSPRSAWADRTTGLADLEARNPPSPMPDCARVFVPRELGDRRADRVKSRSVIGATEATPGRRWHSLTASCTHTASDFLVILIDRGVEDFSG